MAPYSERDISSTLAAAKRWLSDCFVADGAILAQSHLWTLENLQRLRTQFRDTLDEGEGKFGEKLAKQMEGAPPHIASLMSELLWIMYLFPSNIGPDRKRFHIRNVREQAAIPTPENHPLLSDLTLSGIGSAGQGFNTNLWREILYTVDLFIAFKGLVAAQRARVVADYGTFVDWIIQVPMEGSRQFRHMLRYFLYPELVERMSSNTDRVSVLEAYGKATRKDMSRWSDRQFDSAMLDLRRELEREYPNESLDFYIQPLRAQWKAEDEETIGKTVKDSSTSGYAVAGASTIEETRAANTGISPINRIYYGPPGTGKTFLLQQVLKTGYTDAASDVDIATWHSDQTSALVQDLTWWEVIAAAMYALGRPATVPELVTLPIVQAQARAMGRTGKINATLWAMLQNHTVAESKTVSTQTRQDPQIFDKDHDSRWYLSGEWREQIGEILPLVDRLKAGPAKSSGSIDRFSFVTFHQSFSYEEFVEGLAPAVDSATAGIRYEVKRGVFLQLCDRARTDTKHAYALVIDEINRANVSRVFGELITLIESDKRAGEPNAISVTLPYSRSTFSVPSNVHIIGTMNTADRSLAGLDLALRRRFEFVEMPPKPELLSNRFVEGIDLGQLLDIMNQRIEVLLDRDHQLGHAYFMSIQSGDPLSKLETVFRNQIIPLLQEYFFEDWQRIAWVLNDHRKDQDFRFLQRPVTNVEELFGREDGVPSAPKRWRINDAAFGRADSYAGIIRA